MATFRLGVDAQRLEELKSDLEELKIAEAGLAEMVELGMMHQGLLDASQETMRKLELLIKLSQ